MIVEKNKWNSYRIVEPVELHGLEFESVIDNLEDHPHLWRDECPYVISHHQIIVVEQI